MMASLACFLVFFLCLHACTARLLLASQRQTLSRKDVERFVTADADCKALDGGSDIAQLDNHKVSSVPKGKKRKISYSSKENVSNNNDKDIEVMDYPQPHRKPPIHNKGT